MESPRLRKLQEKVLKRYRIDITQWLFKEINIYIRRWGYEPKTIQVSREVFEELNNELNKDPKLSYSFSHKSKSKFMGINIEPTNSLEGRGYFMLDF